MRHKYSKRIVNDIKRKVVNMKRHARHINTLTADEIANIFCDVYDWNPNKGGNYLADLAISHLSPLDYYFDIEPLIADRGYANDVMGISY